MWGQSGKGPKVQTIDSTELINEATFPPISSLKRATAEKKEQRVPLASEAAL